MGKVADRKRKALVEDTMRTSKRARTPLPRTESIDRRPPIALFPVDTWSTRAMARLYPPANPYLNDPVGWVRDTLPEPFLWSKQREILESLVDNRYTAVHSCHEIGKSYDAAAATCWWLDVHPPGSAFVVTTAPTWPQVNAILWREIRKMHRAAKLPGRINLDCQWYMGSDELVAYGRKPADTDQAAFQGIHALYVLVILDEGCGIPKALYDAADTLAANDYARVLAIGNPDDPAAHFATICAPGSGWNVIHVDAFDSPNFTDEEIPEKLSKLMIGQTWVEERKQRWGIGSPLYESKVRGRFPKISDDTLFPPYLILAAQQNELAGLAHGIYGADIARYGEDETVVYRNRAGVSRLAYAVHKQDTHATSNQFKRVLRETTLEVPMVVDSVGLGAGVYDNLVADELPAHAFNGGDRAHDAERFINRRAECYWVLREEMEAGRVDLDPLDDRLASQLGSLKWKTDTRGRIQIESKDDMRKRGMPSPDRADAVMQTYALPSAQLYTPSVTKRKTITHDMLTREM